MERELSVSQMVKAIVRQRARVTMVGVGVMILGGAIVLSTPKSYSATAVIRVEPQRLGEEMVQRTFNDAVEQRLLAIRQELFARPVLKKAISEFSLYPKLVRDKGVEAAVEAMRKSLTVRVEGESTFEITYEAETAAWAAQVANRLPQLYAEEALRIRGEQAALATRLFEEELSRLKTFVSKQEATIAAFKVQHMGELPEQLESNMRALERVTGLIGTRSDQLRVAEARRSELWRSRYAADTEAGRLKAAEDELNRALLSAEVTWTEEHPERQRLGNELSSVTERRKTAEQQMVTEKREREHATAIVEELKTELAGLEKSARSYQDRLDRTPQWAHELGILHRDYDIARTKYQSLISRQVEAQLAQEFEARGAGSLFKVVSTAAVPLSPSKPDRAGGLFLSLLVALGMALLTGVLLDLRDDSIRAPEEMSGVPVLAVVPRFSADGARQQTPRLWSGR